MYLKKIEIPKKVKIFKFTGGAYAYTQALFIARLSSCVAYSLDRERTIYVFRVTLSSGAYVRRANETLEIEFEWRQRAAERACSGR